MTFLHKNIRRPASHYCGQRWYFVTMCSSNRHAAFADPQSATWFVEILRRESEKRYFAVHAYCVMPDHAHALVKGLQVNSDLLAFLKHLKQETAYEYEKRFHRVLWQKKYYDYILRPKDSPDRIAAYVWLDPVRKGLCRSPHQYPFSGSFVLDWTKVIPPEESLEAAPWKVKCTSPA